jgi:glycosyltransferase involved in cell wall biosynthesis
LSSSILFVNQYYHPDIAATGQNLTDLAEYLSRSGFNVEVWCGRGQYVEGQLAAPSSEVLNGVNVRRFRTTAFARSTRAGRLTNYLSFYLQVLGRLLLGPRRGHVVFLTTPPLLSFLGYLSGGLRGHRYAVWSMDLHPEAEIAAGMLTAKGVVAQVLHRLSDAGYANADFVVDLGRHMQQRIADRGVDRARLHTVCIWTDADEVEPVKRVSNPVRRELGIGEETVVTYSGNAGLAHRFGELCAAMKCLADDSAFRFVFLGDGPRRREIEHFANSNNIDNFEYLDYFPRSELRFSLSLPDIHLVTLRAEFAGIAVPAKLYGIMAAARPVLFVGPADCESADLINDTQCGAVVDPDRTPDPVGTIVRTLREWSAAPEVREELGRLGRAAVLERYSRDICCTEFESIIRRYWGGPMPPVDLPAQEAPVSGGS